MTGKEMVDLLGVMVDDIDHGKYNKELKLTILNTAASEMFGKLYPQYLTQFEKTKGSVVDEFDISTITDSIRGGVNAVKYVYISSQDKYAVKISKEEFTKNTNVGMGDYYNTPMYYFEGTKIRLIPDDATAVITYIVNPDLITYSDSIPTLFFDAIFHKSIVDIAKAMLLDDYQLEMVAYARLKDKCNEFSGTDSTKNNLAKRIKYPTDPQWGNI